MQIDPSWPKNPTASDNGTCKYIQFNKVVLFIMSNAPFYLSKRIWSGSVHAKGSSWACLRLQSFLPLFIATHILTIKKGPGFHDCWTKSRASTQCAGELPPRSAGHAKGGSWACLRLQSFLPRHRMHLMLRQAGICWGHLCFGQLYFKTENPPVIRVHVNLFDEKMSGNEKVHWTSEGA